MKFMQLTPVFLFAFVCAGCRLTIECVPLNYSSSKMNSSCETETRSHKKHNRPPEPPTYPPQIEEPEYIPLLPPATRPSTSLIPNRTRPGDLLKQFQDTLRSFDPDATTRPATAPATRPSMPERLQKDLDALDRQMKKFKEQGDKLREVLPLPATRPSSRPAWNV